MNIKQPSVSQFILYSTSPRSKSWEGLLSPDDPPGSEQGAFTGALLDGLKGQGTALLYNVNDNEYVVNTNSLFDHVIKKVIDRNIFVFKDPVHPVIQRPKKGGENAGNPVLARFQVDDINPQPLELFVEPTDVWPSATLEISDQIHDFKQVFDPPVTGVPLSLPPLKPMTYTVRASAPSYVLEGKNRKVKSFDLYEPTKFTVRLVPLEVEVIPQDSSPPMRPSPRGGVHGSGGGRASGGTATTGSSAGGAVSSGGLRGLDDFVSAPWINSRGIPSANEGATDTLSRQEVSLKELTHLIVEASDPLSPLEITDSMGVLMKAGQGRIKLTGLEPGFYRARLITPEGHGVEEIIELSQGETEVARLDAPAPPKTKLLEEVIEAANFLVQDDNTLDVSKTVGPIASAQLSTILALAADVANQDGPWGTRLKGLGFIPFKDVVPAGTISGLQIISGVDFTMPEEASEYISHARLRLWPQGQQIPELSEPPMLLTSVAGIAEFAKATQPEPHWLAVEIQGQMPVAFALCMLPQRLTMLVFHRDVEGRMRIFQYLPGLNPDESSGPDMIRRLELMQRFYLSGRFNNAYELAKDPLNAEVVDPLVCCLGGHLAIKLNEVEGLSIAATKMNRFYSQMSDGFVLMGEYETLMGRTNRAAEAFREALEHKLPIFADGLARLYDGVQRYNIDHPSVNLLTRIFDNRIRGLLWSAWAVGPEKLSPGKTLEE